MKNVQKTALVAGLMLALLAWFLLPDFLITGVLLGWDFDDRSGYGWIAVTAGAVVSYVWSRCTIDRAVTQLERVIDAAIRRIDS